MHGMGQIVKNAPQQMSTTAVGAPGIAASRPDLAIDLLQED
jgi:hypothetical protein